MKKTLFKPYIISVLLALLVGILAALLSGNISDAFNTLVKPPLSPPSVLFPIVWSILYILMGISSARIFTAISANGNDKSEALKIYLIQLFVNFLWPIIFFRFGFRFIAFLWIVLLVILIADMIARFYKVSKKAAYLQIPYFVWSIFATYLNIGFYILNR